LINLSSLCGLTQVKPKLVQARQKLDFTTIFVLVLFKTNYLAKLFEILNFVCLVVVIENYIFLE